MYVITATKSGAFIEPVELHGKKSPALVAHYHYECAVDRVTDCIPTPTTHIRKAPTQKKQPASDEKVSTDGEALFGLIIYW